MESKSESGTKKRRESRQLAPEALKAFAHPLRMAMYNQLQRLGSATASQLARSLGESSGQTSYHLRQLQRHGFVEDDPSRSGGRERWWRPVGFEVTDPTLLQDPDTSGSARALLESVIAERAATLSSWYSSLDPAQADTLGLISAASLNLTAEEAERLTEELSQVVKSYSQLADERDPIPGNHRYRVHLDVFPLTTADPK